MANETKKLTYIVEINNKGKVKIDGLTKGFVKAETAVKRLNTELQKTTKDGLNPMIDKTGLAGATVVELGRTISDSNYGIRGMANNLSQLSTLMITLITTTGGVVNGFKAIWAALSGPLGVIIVFQTLIALYEKYTMESDKAEKSAGDFSKAISDSKEDLSGYLTIIEDIVLTQSQLNTLLEGAAASDKAFYDSLAKSNLSQDERNEKIKQYLSLSNLVATVEGNLKEVRSELQEQGNISSLEEIQNLEKKIKKEEEIAKRLVKTDRATAEASIGLLKTELAAEKEKASEVVKLRLREAELFQILAKYRQDQLDLTKKEKATKNPRVKALELEIDLRRKFFLLDEEGRTEMIRGYKEYMKEAFSRMTEGTDAFFDNIKYLSELEREAEKRREESLKKGLAFIKEEAREINDIFKSTQQAFGSISDVIMSYHDVRMEALARERDYILNSGRLSGEQQRKAIADIEIRELAAQKRKIKAERELFTIKQSLLIAEEIMNAKADLRANARKMGLQLSQIGSEAAVQAGKAQMSIGAFAAEGGLKGMAAYAISIVGMLASIAAARRKAKAQLMALGAPSSGGGGGMGVEAPDFNVVGASPESQLAQTVSEQQEKPLRAFVVHKDIKNANSLDRTITETSALG
jgi:hypothetical protein